MRLHHPILFSVLLLSHFLHAQKKFKVVAKETATWQTLYCLVDEKEKLIRELDTAKYIVCINYGEYVNFAVFGIKGKQGWMAIDADENVLFNVYNTSFGEPSPDELREGKIRIVDDSGRIGFANSKGEIIIKPQFEVASSFHKGKAVIGQRCEKVPWGNHDKETGCHHYSMVCKKHGYINEKGTIVKIGDYSVEQIMKDIGWKPPEE